jgi:hypothetical protein
VALPTGIDLYCRRALLGDLIGINRNRSGITLYYAHFNFRGKWLSVCKIRLVLPAPGEAIRLIRTRSCRPAEPDCQPPSDHLSLKF